MNIWRTNIENKKNIKELLKFNLELIKILLNIIKIIIIYKCELKFEQHFYIILNLLYLKIIILKN